MRFSTFSTNIGRDCRHINDILLIKGCVHQTLSNDDDVLWVLYKTFTYPIGVVMIEVWSCPLFSREIQPTVFHYKYVLYWILNFKGTLVHASSLTIYQN